VLTWGVEMPFKMKIQVQRRDRSAAPSQGFTLLEVLIALLVLTIGLVGLAVLTVQSLQNTHSALYSSLASSAALDIEERLWLDLGRRAAGCPAPNINFPNAFATTWAAGGTNLGLPGLVFTTTTDTTIPVNNPVTPLIRRLVFDITWDERRFGENTDTFTYEARVLCRAGSS
jgi:type IV pilus assembly protein PilV